MNTAIWRRRSKHRRSTAVLWTGPSELDPRTTVMLVASCLDRPSANAKTGDLIQVAVYRTDMAPVEAWTSGQTGPVCPAACVHRPTSEGGAGTCYVNKGRLNAPWLGARSLYLAGKVGPIDLSGAKVRAGMEGDPAAVPLSVWHSVLKGSAHVGYTAHWRSLDASTWGRLFMASVSSPADALRARSAGWRVFASSGSEIDDQSFASISLPLCEAVRPGIERTCEQCMQCNGSERNAERPGRWLPFHGRAGVLARSLAEKGGQNLSALL